MVDLNFGDIWTQTDAVKIGGFLILCMIQALFYHIIYLKIRIFL